jgi:hypothetical protein
MNEVFFNENLRWQYQRFNNNFELSNSELWLFLEIQFPCKPGDTGTRDRKQVML